MIQDANDVLVETRGGNAPNDSPKLANNIPAKTGCGNISNETRKPKDSEPISQTTDTGPQMGPWGDGIELPQESPDTSK